MGMCKKIEKKKWPLIRITKYTSIGLFILVVGYGLIFSTGELTLRVDPEHLTIYTVKSGPFQEFIPIIKNVLPNDTIYLDAMEGGRVETISLLICSLSDFHSSHTQSS